MPTRVFNDELSSDDSNNAGQQVLTRTEILMEYGGLIDYLARRVQMDYLYESICHRAE